MSDNMPNLTNHGSHSSTIIDKLPETPVFQPLPEVPAGSTTASPVSTPIPVADVAAILNAEATPVVAPVTPVIHQTSHQDAIDNFNAMFDGIEDDINSELEITVDDTLSEVSSLD